MPRYNPASIEPKWQQFWEQNKVFRTPEMPTSEKLYILDMFPYPSGSGLHVGHPEGYTATDILCRFERMRGKSVLHPMGFDAFGLPAEEHAIKTGQHPRGNTEQNIAEFTRQLKMLGFSYDWDRVLATTDVEYFKWTQWIFLVLFDTWFDPEQQKGRPISELPIPTQVAEQGENAVRLFQDSYRLAYQADAMVNWCAGLGTVLANEEVIDGKSERGNHPVVRMPLRQWMLRITAYADRLENDLTQVSWPEGIKKLQKDWIGRSTGAEVDFFIGAPYESPGGVPNFEAYKMWWACRAGMSDLLNTEHATPYSLRVANGLGSTLFQGFPKYPEGDVLRIYTTRPDTLFGATYMVIAPEHPYVGRLTTPEQLAAVQTYCQLAASKSDRDRQDASKKKTGVFTGSYCINPVNGVGVPIWIADYVLINYGTGAIMAVPAHDERDFEFAQQFGIEVIPVVAPGPELSDKYDREEILAGKQCFPEIGFAMNSGNYDGTPTPVFKRTITNDLSNAGLGREAVNYKLRDWLFSRQRFWGEPFPILHELNDDGTPNGLIRAVDFKDLPVDLPHLDDFKPHGRPEPPLAKAPADWLTPTIDGKKYRRETNTMPQWAGSCWYYLRFIDPRNDEVFVDREKEKAWMPVDLYVGGAEHAVLHLLYSRFWHKVLYDRGYVSSPEPFQRLINQGIILGEMEYQLAPSSVGEWKAKLEERGLVMHEIEVDEEKVFLLKQPGDAVGELKNLREDQVEKRKGKTYLAGTDLELSGKSEKMSKSRGNVVSPNEVVAEFGADSLRLYEMFMGPLEQSKPWSMAGVSGVRGFLDRLWRLIVDHLADEVCWNAAVQDVPPTDAQLRFLHKTIKVVTKNLEELEFNIAIARLMEFVNFFTAETVRPKSVLEQFVLLVSPLAPHICEELWRILGHDQSLAYEPWPTFDESLTQDASIEIPVQVLGKMRGKVIMPADSSEEQIVAAAKEDPKVAELLNGKEIVKTIYVKGKMVNFVVK